MSNPTEIQSSNAQQVLERVKTQSGPAYWRSLEELAATPEFQARMKKEFSSQESQWIDPVTRRNFLKLMGASLALSGLTACNVRRPNEALVPYINQPEGMVLGKPLFYATAMPFGGYGYPVLVESHEGRPTKIEGNPDHPASLGAAFSWQQASVLSLYDPDRAQVISKQTNIRAWTDFVAEIHKQVENERGGQGKGVRILTGTVTSPSFAGQIRRFLQQFPQAKWVQYDPSASAGAAQAARHAFGQPVDTSYAFEKASVVLSLDSDFMIDGPGALYYSKQFANRRRVRTTTDEMVRLYAVESTPTNTGSLSDHRLAVRASQVEDFARAVAQALGVQGAAPAGYQPNADAKFVSAVVRDLQANKGRSVIVAGDHQPTAVHVLAHAMNAALGNVGQTVVYTQPVEAQPSDQLADLRQLVTEMNAGTVSTLVIIGGNPVYDAPGDLNFLQALEKVPFRAHLTDYVNETAEFCHWQIPATHYLESWGDVRAFNGLASIVQPLIAPLYPSSRTPYEMIGAMLGEGSVSAYDVVRNYWQGQRQGGDFEQFWRRILHDGFISGSQTQPAQVTARPDAVASLPAPAAQKTGLDIVFRPDPCIRWGSFANLGWLQELPKPFTKITWENFVMVSTATAKKLGVAARRESQFENVDEVELTYNGQKVRGPIIPVAGQADDTVTVYLGYGRTKAGRIGGLGNETIGFDAYALQTAAAPGVGTGAEIRRTGGSRKVAQTQMHFAIDQGGIEGLAGYGKKMGEALSMEDRGIVRTATLEHYRKEPDFVAHQGPHTPAKDLTLYNGAWEYKGYAWGMAIDMNACHGCGSCVVACQAENNIPVVGKDQVLLQRELHWLRIDQYYTGDPENPSSVRVFNQPMLCQHCENAPCEYVCPVVATLHSDEGTSDMIYNRCVGTRFCSNNCPYKVRRFNYFAYADFGEKNPLTKLLYNPDVTVRSRGVMEKCSFCIQRIAYARQEAESDNRKIRDGEVVTACQATCPTDAIVFGNINDPSARVTQLKANSLNYGVLTDLNTRPRVTYLAKLINENAELQDHKG